jgi:hypothetical protein
MFGSRRSVGRGRARRFGRIVRLFGHGKLGIDFGWVDELLFIRRRSMSRRTSSVIRPRDALVRAPRRCRVIVYCSDKTSAPGSTGLKCTSSDKPIYGRDPVSKKRKYGLRTLERERPMSFIANFLASQPSNSSQWHAYAPGSTGLKCTSSDKPIYGRDPVSKKRKMRNSARLRPASVHSSSEHVAQNKLGDQAEGRPGSRTSQV